MLLYLYTTIYFPARGEATGKNMSKNILGVRIDTHSVAEIMRQIEHFLRGAAQHTIGTPNPEMLVCAAQNKRLRNILNSNTLNLCDGFGITLLSTQKITRLPGIDLMMRICNLAEDKNYRVYFLGTGDREVLENAVQKILNKFPKLKIVGYHEGLPISYDNNDGLIYDKKINEQILVEIKSSKPDILFVAFGHGKQECWLSENLTRLPTARIGMGVGGSFEFISGAVRRAPRLFRSLGLEWLWRLVAQPWRIKRIFTAVVVFPWLRIAEILRQHNQKSYD